MTEENLLQRTLVIRSHYCQYYTTHWVHPLYGVKSLRSTLYFYRIIIGFGSRSFGSNSVRTGPDLVHAIYSSRLCCRLSRRFIDADAIHLGCFTLPIGPCKRASTVCYRIDCQSGQAREKEGKQQEDGERHDTWKYSSKKHSLFYCIYTIYFHSRL